MIKVGLYTGTEYDQNSMLKIPYNGREVPVVLYEIWLDDEYYYMSDMYRLHIDKDDSGNLQVKRGVLVHPSEIEELPENIIARVEVTNNETYQTAVSEMQKGDTLCSRQAYYFMTSVRWKETEND